MSLRTTTIVVAAALLLGGCADRDGDVGPTTTTTAADTTTTTATTSTLVTTTTVADAASRCSASDLSPDLTNQEGLPEPVAETRRRIARAAVACDYEALAGLAGANGTSFTYSFGDSGDPARYWEREEEEGTGDPMRHLVGILDRPHAVVNVGGVTRYAWPSAFTYDSWSAVPERDREALRPLYDDADFESFERFGGYIGYRVIILPDGTWTVFVAGD